MKKGQEPQLSKEEKAELRDFKMQLWTPWWEQGEKTSKVTLTEALTELNLNEIREDEEEAPSLGAILY